MLSLHILLSLTIVSTVLANTTSFHSNVRDVENDLRQRLSADAQISTNVSLAPRWSDYHAPQYQYIVHVAQEQDVAETVKYCNEHGLPFLAQSGGHGWATFNMDAGVGIDLRGLNLVSFNDARDRVFIGGGVSNGELVEAAYAAEVQVLNGGCNCVGVLGATLGGGVSRWMNRYGLPADNIVSANVVTAGGDLIQVSSSSHPDLLWAMRGAGANFGIVTSLEMQAYPTIDSGRLWAGELIFSGDKLPRFIEAMNNLNLTEDMTVHFGFYHSAEGEPIISAEIFFMRGDVEAGRRAFQSLYDLQPDNDTTAVVTYDHINDDTIELCEDGGRKPGWHVGLRTLDYPAFQNVWDEYVDFVAQTGLLYSAVLVECYSNYVLRQIGSANAAYAHRDIQFYAWTIPLYENPDQDGIAEEYGSRVRDIWRGASGFDQPRAYMNFAHGDEPPEEIYGESLPRLKVLKRQWDPQGRFNQWFPIV